VLLENENQYSNLMNWKIIVGGLLIFGALSEFLSIINDYRSGKLAFWPFGADIGCVIVIALGIYLVNKGRKEVKRPL